MFYKNQFLRSFRLEVFFRHLCVDMKEHVRSVSLGKWLFFSLYSMYEINRRAPKDEVSIIVAPHFMGYTIVTGIGWMWAGRELFAIQ